MRYLADTDWVVEYLKGRAPAVTLLTGLAQDGLAISVITYGEVYEGIHYGRDPKAHEVVFRRFLKGVTVLPVTRSIAHRFAVIRGHLRAGGELIPQPDLLIAATALHHSLALATRNVRDFQRIPDLELCQMETSGE